MEIRKARPGDGEAIALIWAENAAYYAEAFPNDFRLPEVDRFGEELERALAREQKDDHLWLVADVDGVIAGQLSARIEPPVEHAQHQMLSHLTETRLLIDSLGTARAFQRRGIATALVEEAEEWGRTKGTTRAILDTYVRSELAMPFWEKRMRYTPHSMIFHKLLGRPPASLGQPVNQDEV